MKKYFSIGEAAKIVGVTAETLRHYDRIGLVKPGKKDDWTSYRYYDEQDIVLLNTVRALQIMNIPLKKIKEILECDDFEQIIEYMDEAERKADEKIALIEYSKSKIHTARRDFENKLCGMNRRQDIFIKSFDERIILLSDTLETPTLDNLWNYLSHYYDKIPLSKRNDFQFEDLAGIYSDNEQTRLFAMCVRYSEISGLKRLPAGDYLCVNCTEENKESKTKELFKIAKEKYNITPTFFIHQIVLSGILQWTYQIQVCVDKKVNG